MARDLPLHCPSVGCDAYCGTEVRNVWMHFVYKHPDETLPTVWQIKHHSQLVVDRYRLRHLVGALEALIPEE